MKQWLGDLLPPRDDRPMPRRRHPAPTLADGPLRTAWQAISLLLDYPDDRLFALLPTLRTAASALPAEVGGPLGDLVAHLAASDRGVLREEYVATFDTTRKCALHLSYYSYGDTRKRGVALVQFKQAYRRAGLIVTDAELPDHLSVLLEFGATGDVGVAWRLLNDNRAGIELLQIALDDRRSPWADAVRALRATLPPLDGDTTDAVARLIAEGPPSEDVGLDAYALDPRLNPHPAADDALQGVMP